MCRRRMSEPPGMNVTLLIDIARTIIHNILTSTPLTGEQVVFVLFFAVPIILCGGLIVSGLNNAWDWAGERLDAFLTARGY